MGFHKDEVKKLREIHKAVMTGFIYTTDQEKHKLAEYWEDTTQLAPMIDGSREFRGDCEEFAMVALQKARAKGFDARLVTCWDETGEGHCLTEITTHDGEEAYYIDNRKDHLATLDDLAGYRFYAVSPWNPMPGDQRQWYLVDD